MTNEEMIKDLSRIMDLLDMHIDLNQSLNITQMEVAYLSLKCIVRALEQQPCEDCISRQATLKAFAEKCGGECGCCEYNGSGYDTAENCKLIKSMPAVTPQPKRGKWEISTTETLDGQGLYECSVCGHLVFTPIYNNYCPNCGAKMEVEE